MVHVRRRDTGVSRVRSGPTAKRIAESAVSLGVEQVEDVQPAVVVAQDEPEPRADIPSVEPGSRPTESELWAMRVPELKTQAADEGISTVHALKTKREIVTAILENRNSSHGW